MLLRVMHDTVYHYSAEVSVAQHMLHLRPRATDSQSVLQHHLRVDPAPEHSDEVVDAQGNHRRFLALQTPHQRLHIRADSLVHTQAPLPLAQLPHNPAWETVRDALRYRAGAPHDPAIEYRFHTPATPWDETFLAFVWPVLDSGLGIADLAQALNQRIHHQMRYDPCSTSVHTPTTQALAQRAGVCQDFAHLFIACWRQLGLPARYVSGYLLTQPAYGQSRLVGADASHAWVSVYVPHPQWTGQGCWIDLDPTNNRCGWGSPGEEYVTLAWGRDFADVSPVRGVIQGGGSHRLQVAVTVAPPDEWPGEPLL